MFSMHCIFFVCLLVYIFYKDKSFLYVVLKMFFATSFLFFFFWENMQINLINTFFDAKSSKVAWLRFIKPREHVLKWNIRPRLLFYILRIPWISWYLLEFIFYFVRLIVLNFINVFGIFRSLYMFHCFTFLCVDVLTILRKFSVEQ